MRRRKPEQPAEAHGMVMYAVDVMQVVHEARMAAEAAFENRQDMLAAVDRVMHDNGATCTECNREKMRSKWTLNGATIVLNLRNGPAISVVDGPYLF